ncbi:unnamed protein product [Clavelina lepadiformis]|uniref:Peptide deformylase n=1 Tax=Clavelina lepadiformis TaxID=159417 RepID=A0ABP0FUP5_CLALP
MAGGRKVSFVQHVRHLLARKKPPYKHIVQIGDPVLRKKCKEIPRNEILKPTNQHLISELVKMMRSRHLYSLSAPQIGVPLKIFVAELTDLKLHSNAPEKISMETFPLKIFINPRMEVIDDKVCVELESCHSLHSYSAQVPRFKSVHVRGFDKHGEAIEWLASGWSARVIQHEYDHMDGIMYIDKMNTKTFSDINWQLYNYQGKLHW